MFAGLKVCLRGFDPQKKYLLLPITGNNGERKFSTDKEALKQIADDERAVRQNRNSYIVKLQGWSNRYNDRNERNWLGVGMIFRIGITQKDFEKLFEHVQNISVVNLEIPEVSKSFLLEVTS